MPTQTRGVLERVTSAFREYGKHDAIVRRDDLVKEHLARLPADALVVNVGCALVRRFEEDCPARYLATDLRVLDNVDFSSDATQLPLADDSVDMLITLEMLEHVPDPPAVVRELARVLKPGGTVLLSVPSAVPRHDNHDYWRFTAQGLQQMCEPVFDDGEVVVFGGTFETLGYLAAYYVSLLLHVLKVPGRTFRQFFPTVGHAIDRRAGWTTSTDALHTLAFDLLFVGHGTDGQVTRARPEPAELPAQDPEPWAPAP
ncbi:MAG TPA: methyltransferase domain-containing protein [Acidimicrobiales bacterium]